MFGQVGFFTHGGKDFEDKRPRDRYVNEARRLLGVLDRRLEGRDWVMGDYSMADIAIFPGRAACATSTRRRAGRYR